MSLRKRAAPPGLPAEADAAFDEVVLREGPPPHRGN